MVETGCVNPYASSPAFRLNFGDWFVDSVEDAWESDQFQAMF